LENGFLPETLWYHPANAKLKLGRRKHASPGRAEVNIRPHIGSRVRTGAWNKIAACFSYGLGLRQVVALCLVFFLAMSASAQDRSFRIFQTFSGRYHCAGQWTDFQFTVHPVTGLLGMEEPDAGVTASITFYFHRSVTSLDAAAYKLAGPYDTKTGRFHLEPKEWYGPHPAVFEMIGIEGTFNATSETLTARMLSSKCDSVEFAPAGKALPPLPAQPAPQTPASNPARPEMRLMPSNVTDYLDPAAYSPDFEYWVTAWSDPPGTVHEGEPIDEAVDSMKKEKFACVGSQHVTWDASGIKGTAPDQVNITERYVVECVGNCKGVFYRPYAGAQVVHFGLTEPLPTMQIKSVWLGGTTFRWNFSRTNKSQQPPEIYIHRWTPLAGFGPFDPGPAEVARRQAAAPPCKAPKTNNK
jgi:hypothetical protein